VRINGVDKFTKLGNTVAIMISYVICSSLILVINDNMINETNHILEHVLVGIPLGPMDITTS
jgi:hypothetical protein